MPKTVFTTMFLRMLAALLTLLFFAGCQSVPVAPNAEQKAPLEQEYENESDEIELPLIDDSAEQEQASNIPDEVVVVPKLPTQDESGAFILGTQEHIYFPSVDAYATAGIDQDLRLSTVRVSSLVPFERNGDKWVTFRLMLDGKLTNEYSLPVKRWLKRPNGDEESSREPIVSAWIQVGALRENTDFVLSQSTEQPFPFMLGQSFYRDLAVVDESRSFVQPKPTK